MGYIESNLLPDEKIVYKARLHWIIFWKSCALVILGGIFLLIQPIIGGVVILIGLFALPSRADRLRNIRVRRHQQEGDYQSRVSAPKNTGVVATPRGSDIGGPKRDGQVAKLRLRNVHGDRRRERSVSTIFQSRWSFAGRSRRAVLRFYHRLNQLDRSAQLQSKSISLIGLVMGSSLAFLNSS